MTNVVKVLKRLILKTLNLEDSLTVKVVRLDFDACEIRKQIECRWGCNIMF